MSGGLAPSKTTVYVSNLPFSLTNNDLHKIFEKYGKVVKITILRDKVSRQSKGVAFVLFLERESVQSCIRALNNAQMFGRTLQCSLAKDNGRASEFIRRKDYPDKSKCYECGEEGHLSYKCPKNMLGERKPPPKKKKKNKDNDDYDDEEEEEEEEEEETPKKRDRGEDGDEEEEEQEGEDPKMESLSAAIQFEREKLEEEDYRYRVATSSYDLEEDDQPKRKKYKKDAYFSDEEEIEDD